MESKDKARVTMTRPDRDAETYEADFLMAAIRNEEKEGTRIVLYGNATGEKVFLSCAAIIRTALKQFNLEAEKRGYFYVMGIETLKEQLRSLDPDACHAAEELLEPNELVRMLYEEVMDR